MVHSESTTSIIIIKNVSVIIDMFTGINFIDTLCFVRDKTVLEIMRTVSEIPK